MFLKQPAKRGFTIVELLVTLVLLALVASLVIPGVDTWLSSREADIAKKSVSNYFAQLPLKAKLSGEKITIETLSLEELNNINLTFEKPIVVLENGYCIGGSFKQKVNQIQYKFDVTPPFCQVVQVDES